MEEDELPERRIIPSRSAEVGVGVMEAMEAVERLAG